MNKTALGKTMENMRKHGNIKFVTTEKRRNYLVLEPIQITSCLSNDDVKFLEENRYFLSNVKILKIVSHGVVFSKKITKCCKNWLA